MKPDCPSWRWNCRIFQYDRGAVKLGKPVRQALRSIAEISDRQLKVEKLALTRNIANLKEKVQAFRPNLSKAVDSGNAALRKFEQEMKKEEESIFRWYEQELQALYAGGMAIFDVNRHRNTDFINRAVESGIAPRERELHLERKQRIADSVKAALERSGGELIQMMQGLQTELEEIVGQEETPSAGKQELALLGNNSPQESSFFEDIFNELETAWESRTSVIAKAIIGTGMVLTAVAGSLAFLFNKLFGQEDPKEKLKSSLPSSSISREKPRYPGLTWNGKVSIKPFANRLGRTLTIRCGRSKTSFGSWRQAPVLNSMRLKASWICSAVRNGNFNKFARILRNWLADYPTAAEWGRKCECSMDKR